MHVALIEHAEHDIDGENRSADQIRLSGERLLKHPCRSLKAAVDRCRDAETAHLILDRRRSLAERDSGSEIERDGRSDEQILMIDRERRVALREMSESRERHHRLVK